jgi:hypothetical protein
MYGIGDNVTKELTLRRPPIDTVSRMNRGCDNEGLTACIAYPGRGAAHPVRFRLRVLNSVVAFVVLACAGCAVGPHYLKGDQVAYARALGEAKKREILAMIVGLRYADAPGFLNVSQIIASYAVDATGTILVNSIPSPGTEHGQATGTVEYSTHPTFTFTPTTGEYFAKAYIHPLAPALILPLADSGIPIDLLLRIAVQSIAGLDNATMLGGASGNGTPEFFELLHVLRRLQLAGEVSFRYKPGSNSQTIILFLAASPVAHSPTGARDLARARELLGLPAGQTDYEIVSASESSKPGEVSIATRSVLAILSDLGAEIAVPDSDLKSGATKPAIALLGGETRPIVVVHSGLIAPLHNYTAVDYASSKFWIEASDFDSKYALSLVQDLMALAEVTDTSRAPVVTIPAN